MPSSKEIFSNWKLVYFILVFCILWFASAYILFDFNEESTRANIRWSARFGLLCFCFAFGASSMHLLFPNRFSQWLYKNRRYLGVAFALVHLIHLFFIIALHQWFEQIFSLDAIHEVALGGLAYLFTVLMLLTSFDKFSKAISIKNWKRLHTIGGYWIFIVFSNSIFGRVIEGQLSYLPLAILVLSIWILRALAWMRNKVKVNT